MRALEALCVQRGLRLAEHRRIVLEVLEQATDHPCAGEIHRRAAAGHRIGIATVYRALNSLVEAGVVRRQACADGKAHYEPAGSVHPHLIDIDTGHVVEIDDDRLAVLIEGTARSLGFRLVDFRLRLFGVSRRRSSGT